MSVDALPRGGIRSSRRLVNHHHGALVISTVGPGDTFTYKAIDNLGAESALTTVTVTVTD